MMPDYHIGSLDEASRKVLAEPEPANESSTPRPVFLDSRAWNKTQKPKYHGTREFSPLSLITTNRP
jgi:hypothetical protein